MRTIWEIITQEGRAKEYVNSEGTIYDRDEVEKLVRKAMIEVIDDILTRENMIWILGTEDRAGENIYEARYAKPLFEEYKNDLK